MKVYTYPRRREPYTAIGAWRLSCVGCGAPHSVAQARCCADGSHRPFCAACHEAGIQEVLTFLGIPGDPAGRTKPYADYGLYRTPCVRCGARARYEWLAGQAYRPVCPDCDLALNAIALRQARHPDADRLYAAYRTRVNAECAMVPRAALRPRAVRA